jgi:hypothetical protein
VPFASRVAELFAGVAALADAVVPLGIVAGAPLAAVGIVALTVATRRRLPLAIAGGAAVGALAAVALRELAVAHFGVSPATTVILLAVAGSAAGALAPAAFPFAVAALPGALIGAQVPLAGRAVFGAAAGALVAGVAGLALGRLVAVAFASLCGGLLVALGLLALFGGSPLARELAGRPAAVAGFAIVLAIAGVAFQAARTPEDPGARSLESQP